MRLTMYYALFRENNKMGVKTFNLNLYSNYSLLKENVNYTAL